jgi:hypothetical protein
MSDPIGASNARAMGNYGLASSLSGRPNLDSYGDDDMPEPPSPAEYRRKLKWRVLRWTVAALLFLAVIYHI